MRARYIIITFLLSYLILLFVSACVELWYVNSKAKHIQCVVQTAADMALDQTQVTDDFFVLGEGYHVASDTSTFKIRIQKGDNYEEVDLFEGIFGITDKERIFNMIFKNENFNSFVIGLGNVRTPVMFWNEDRSDFEWYSMARIVQVGLDTTGDYSNIYNLKHLGTGNLANSVTTQNLYNEYKLNNAKRVAYEGNDGEMEYFVTPISIGITYLNPEFLGVLFMNNMDLLMRSKYAKEDISLLSSNGGQGVYQGFTYVGMGSWDVINDNNPINDGIFTLVRGPEISVVGGYNVYKGIIPEISYRVIDMYDSDNDDILTLIFGAKSDIGGVVYASKSEYFKAVDLASGQNINPLNDTLFDTKLIVVAKITFHADIIVPYTTIYSRFFRGKLEDGISNYLDLKRESSSVTWSGNRSFTYTRYFAVAY